jgi:putative lipoprotein
MNPRAALVLCALLVACAGNSGKPGRVPPLSAGQTLVYECGEYEFVVRAGADEVALYLPDDYRVLGRVRSASGARYEDGELVFWSKGDEAMLDVGAKRYRGCLLNPSRGPWEDARRRGVSFRAVGQEPGWVLEIQPQRNMLLVADYGGRRVLLPTPDSELLDGVERYEAADDRHRLVVEIELRHCFDSMSGEAYSNRVRVILDQREYRGCGESLEPL